MESFELGLCRIMYVRTAVRRVPPCVAFILGNLADKVTKSRHHACGAVLRKSQVAPRVDAQASDESTSIGRWYPSLRADGSVDLRHSQWYSTKITGGEWPLVHCIGGSCEFGCSQGFLRQRAKLAFDTSYDCTIVDGQRRSA